MHQAEGSEIQQFTGIKTCVNLHVNPRKAAAEAVFSLAKLSEVLFNLLGKLSHPCAPSNSCGKKLLQWLLNY